MKFLSYLPCCLYLLFAAEARAINQTDPRNFEPVHALAMQGDYQAQRNIAYGYVATSYDGQQKNPLLGCAWYMVVLHSGNRRVDEGDVGNARVYCGRLAEDARAAATAQARTLFRTIYKREAKF